MQIKPSGVVDVCVEGISLSAHFHSCFSRCAGEEEVLGQLVWQ